MTAALVVLFAVSAVLGLGGGALVWRHRLLRAAERRAVAARAATARLSSSGVSLVRGAIKPVPARS